MPHPTLRTTTYPTRSRTALRLTIALTITVVLGVAGLAVFSQRLLAEPRAGSSEGWPAAGAAPAGLSSGESGTWAAHGPLSEIDGLLPETATVFDAEYPAVGQLDPALLEALQLAANAAAAEGIEFNVNSGWRTPALQLHMQREAVSQYGSAEEAARWVASPETSAHVSGGAVDIGPFDASYWLQNYGAQFGLCQVYANESWHFELRPEAPTDGCPLMYENPSQDPAMQG